MGVPGKRRVMVSLLAVGAWGVLTAAKAEPGGPAVHTLAAEAPGIFANSYLVETRTGIVVVDGRLLTSDGKAVRAAIEAIRKPLRAVLVTHGHPDHYNGITEILGGQDLPVVSTAAVDKVIREHDAAKEKQWAETFGPEWPRRRTFPNRILKDGESVTFGDVRFTVHDLGPGESHADSYWTADLGGAKVAFIGDLVLHGVHAYVADGHTTEWLASLSRLRRDLAGFRTLYPGHGEPGGLALLEWQQRYLQEYRAAVKELSNGASRLSEGQSKELVARMKTVLPSEKLEFLIALGADAVAAELAAAGSAGQ